MRGLRVKNANPKRMSAEMNLVMTVTPAASSKNPMASALGSIAMSEKLKTEINATITVVSFFITLLL